MFPKNNIIPLAKQYTSSQVGVPSMAADKPGPVRSTIHQSIEITNGNFTYQISSDGQFIKIERKGENARGGFFLIPIEMWDEVVNFVFQESQRRKADAED